MAFSIRSFFGKEKSPEGPTPMGGTAPPASNGSQNSFPGLPSKPAVSPFSGSGLFKASGAFQQIGPASGSPPVGSPFSPFAVAGTPSSGLTVDDVLPLLPREVSKNPQLPPGQPLQISEEVLSRALSSGTAAIPLFEIYRVCPALFQTPISPQDPRTVSLPPAKIPALLAGRGGKASQAVVNQDRESSSTLFNPSPFSVAGPGAPAAAGASQPGKATASPFGHAGGSPFQVAASSSSTGAPGAASPAAPAFGHVASSAPAQVAVPPGTNPFMTPPAVTATTGVPSSQGGPQSLGAPPEPRPATSFPPQPPAASHSLPYGGQPPSADNPFSIASSEQNTGASPFAQFGKTPAPPAPSAASPFSMPSNAPAAPPPAAPPLASPFQVSPPPPPQAEELAPAPQGAPAPLPSWLQGAGDPNPALSPIAPSPFSMGTPPPGPSGMPAGLNPFESGTTFPPAPPSVQTPFSPSSAAHPAGPAPWEPAASAAAFTPKSTGSSVLPPRQVIQPGVSTASVPLPPQASQSVPVPTPASAAPPWSQPGVSTADPAASPFARIAAFANQGDAPPAPVVPAPLPVPLPAMADFGRPFGAPPVTGVAPSFGSGTYPDPAGAVATPAPVSYPQDTQPASPAAGPAESGADRVKLGLSFLLRSCTAHDIGISPDHIPSWVQASLPLALVQPQIAGGKVTIRLADVLAGLDSGMRHLLTPTRPDMQITIPASEVLHALPGGKDASSAAVNSAPAPTMGLAPASVPEPSPSAPAAVSWPFETRAEAAAAKPPSAHPPAFSFTPAPPLAPPTADAPPFAVAPPFQMPPPPVKPEPAPPAFSAYSPPPFASAPTDSPFPAFAPSAPMVVREPEPPSMKSSGFFTPPGVPAMEAARKPSQAPGGPEKHRQMLLRVLLGSQEEAFDANGVVRLTTGQPGVAAAVCFLEGRPVASAGNGTPEADKFLQQAQRMLDHVNPLVALTGIDDTETVSVKSDRHVVTFSLQGNVTLAVMHDPAQQEPTLREKVTLIARELTGLLHAA